MIRNDDVRGPITYLEFEKAISLDDHACFWLDVSCCSTKLTRTNTILLVFSSQPFMARPNKDGEPYIALVGNFNSKILEARLRGMEKRSEQI